MGQKYIIDTNSLIDAQSKKLPENGLAFLANVINDYFAVSFVTNIKFLGYKNVTQANKGFIDLAIVIEINRDIIDTCIEIRKSYKIKLPDAIIASTALVQNFTIITNNEKDFENIKGLKYTNPYKI